MAQAESTLFGRHGGRLEDAAAAFPAAPRPWLDLSTGINPVAWAPPAALAFDPAPLPGRAALAALEAAAAHTFGADPARVVAVPGTEIALRLVAMLGLPRPIVALRPGYGTHAEIADEVAGRHTLDAPVGRAATLLLANPNNPDGAVLAPERLAAIAARQAAAGGWLAIDEAFADATPACASLPGLAADAPVIVLRSFGKFFGLAGVRLGFVAAPPPVVQRLRALLGDWPVSAQAIAWGRAAYEDAAWIAATRSRLIDVARDLDRLLARHGLIATGASPLFRLVVHFNAPAIFTRLARAGILTRPFDHRADWLRFGLPGDAAAMRRLDDALGDG